MPTMILKVVVLPAPLGPSRPTTSPAIDKNGNAVHDFALVVGLEQLVGGEQPPPAGPAAAPDCGGSFDRTGFGCGSGGFMLRAMAAAAGAPLAAMRFGENKVIPAGSVHRAALQVILEAVGIEDGELVRLRPGMAGEFDLFLRHRRIDGPVAGGMEVLPGAVWAKTTAPSATAFSSSIGDG